MDIETFTNEGRSPDGNIIIFHTRRIKNNFLSQQQDELVYDQIPFMKIISPGQQHSTVDRKVKEKDMLEHKEQWEAFKKKQDLRDNGTPLRDWHGVEHGMVKELEYMNVFTVEDMASVNDANLANIGPGARKLQEAAKLYIEGLNEKDNIIKEKDGIIEVLKKKINQMNADAAKGESGLIQGDNPNEPTDDSARNVKRDWLGRNTN